MAILKSAPLSRDARIGSWIINGCLITTMAAAWGGVRWPLLSTLVVGIVVAAAAASIAVLFIVTYRERLVGRSTAQRAETYHGTYWKLLAGDTQNSLASLEPTQAGALAVQRYAVALRVLQRRNDDLTARMLGKIENISQSKELEVMPAYLLKAGRGVVSVRDFRHFRVETVGERYTVTIGAVQIDVSGDETKVVVRDSKRVTIETPATQPVAPNNNPRASTEIKALH